MAVHNGARGVSSALIRMRFPTMRSRGCSQAGEEAFAAAGASPAVLALWRPRFVRAARWFVSLSNANGAKRSRGPIAEATANWRLPRPGGPVHAGRPRRPDRSSSPTAARRSSTTRPAARADPEADRTSDRAAIAARSGDADGRRASRHAQAARVRELVLYASSRAANRRAKRLSRRPMRPRRRRGAASELIAPDRAYDDERQRLSLARNAVARDATKAITTIWRACANGRASRTTNERGRTALRDRDRSRRLGLGVGQCRRGQDACARPTA